MSAYYLETAYLLKVPIPYKKKLTLLKIATWGFWGGGGGEDIYNFKNISDYLNKTYTSVAVGGGSE